jgi:hypothetical protein
MSSRSCLAFAFVVALAARAFAVPTLPEEPCEWGGDDESLGLDHEVEPPASHHTGLGYEKDFEDGVGPTGHGHDHGDFDGDEEGDDDREDRGCKPVPEPEALVLLAVGAGLLLARRRAA